MRFSFPCSLPKITAIIGGGGKTTLLFKLGQWLAEAGASVLLTTTTHLAFPPPAGTAFCAPATPEEAAAAAQRARLVLMGYPNGSGKMTGLAPQYLTAAAAAFDYVLCEADGSRHMPLKWHRDSEPCIPANTGLIIQIAGLSALGKPAGEVLHRCMEAGMDPAHCIVEEDIVRLMLRAFQHNGATCPAVALLNQADTPELRAQGDAIAKKLRAAGYPAAVCALREDVIGCWF